MRRPRVEQGRRGMDEVSQTQGIVGLLHLFNAVTVELNGNTHPHVLRTLPCASVSTLQKVSPLQSLVAKVVKHKVAGVLDHSPKRKVLRNAIIRLIHNTLIKQNLNNVNQTTGRVLLVIINHETGRQLPIVRVVPSLHHCTRFGGKLVQLRGLDSVLNLTTNLLRDQIRVDMSKSICKLLDASQDLVKGNRHPSSIALRDVHMVRHLHYYITHPYL